MSPQGSVDQNPRPLDRKSIALGALVGAFATLCCVSLLAVLVLGGRFFLPLNSNVDTSARPPSATLHVDADGCTVIRSEVENAGPGRALQWVIVDASGRQVLARNALGEIRYTYFRPGQYDVVLQAFHDGRYVDISQHVMIACR